MAEFISTVSQLVAINNNVLFNETVVPPCCKVNHRAGSGIFTLKGGRYLVSFSANVSGATAGTEVDLALALNGEPLLSSLMASTPAVADDLNNVATSAYIVVPCNCCYQLSVRNTGTTDVTVNNANLIIQREE